MDVSFTLMWYWGACRDFPLTWFMAWMKWIVSSWSLSAILDVIQASLACSTCRMVCFGQGLDVNVDLHTLA